MLLWPSLPCSKGLETPTGAPLLLNAWCEGFSPTLPYERCLSIRTSLMNHLRRRWPVRIVQQVAQSLSSAPHPRPIRRAARGQGLRRWALCAPLSHDLSSLLPSVFRPVEQTLPMLLHHARLKAHTDLLAAASCGSCAHGISASGSLLCQDQPAFVSTLQHA